MTDDEFEFDINYFLRNIAAAWFQSQAVLAAKVQEATARAAFDLGARDTTRILAATTHHQSDGSRGGGQSVNEEKPVQSESSQKIARMARECDDEAEQQSQAQSVVEGAEDAERRAEKALRAPLRRRHVHLLSLSAFKAPVKSEISESVRDAARKLSIGRTLAGPRDIDAVDKAVAALYGEFPWFQPVLADLMTQLRASSENGDGAAFRPLLFVGPPGVGKTRFASRLASALGLHFERHDCAGQDDVRALAGTARGWASAEFAAPIRALLACGHANPLLFLDEIEKGGVRWKHYRPSSLVLPWLERSSASTWQDPLLMAPVDLSHVLWIFGANDLAGLPAPFLSRVSIYEIPSPGPEHFDALFASIVADIEAEERKRAGPFWMMKDDEDEPERDLIEPEVVSYLRDRFSRERLSPRELAKLVKKAADATPRKRGVVQAH